MPKRLRYSDAVRLLGGSGPAMQALDNVSGAALSLATAGTSEDAVSIVAATTARNFMSISLHNRPPAWPNA